VQYTTAVVKSLIKSYLPEEKQQEAHEQLMDIFVAIMQKESTSSELKEELADSLAGFVFTEAHIERVKFWIEKKGVYTADNQLVFEPQNTQDFLNGLIFVLHSFASVPVEYKTATLNAILGEDKSDKASQLRERCNARLPDAAIKAEVWERIVAKNSPDSLVTRNALMAGFYHRSQKDILRPYFTKFFENIEDIQANQTTRYTMNYFAYLLPSMEPRDEFLIELLKIKARTPDVKKMLVQELNEAIDSLLKIQQIKAQAKL